MKIQVLWIITESDEDFQRRVQLPHLFQRQPEHRISHLIAVVNAPDEIFLIHFDDWPRKLLVESSPFLLTNVLRIHFQFGEVFKSLMVEMGTGLVDAWGLVLEFFTTGGQLGLLSGGFYYLAAY